MSDAHQHWSSAWSYGWASGSTRAECDAGETVDSEWKCDSKNWTPPSASSQSAEYLALEDSTSLGSVSQVLQSLNVAALTLLAGEHPKRLHCLIETEIARRTFVPPCRSWRMVLPFLLELELMHNYASVCRDFHALLTRSSIWFGVSLQLSLVGRIQQRSLRICARSWAWARDVMCDLSMCHAATWRNVRKVLQHEAPELPLLIRSAHGFHAEAKGLLVQLHNNGTVASVPPNNQGIMPSQGTMVVADAPLQFTDRGGRFAEVVVVNPCRNGGGFRIGVTSSFPCDLIDDLELRWTPLEYDTNGNPWQRKCNLDFARSSVFFTASGRSMHVNAKGSSSSSVARQIGGATGIHPRNPGDRVRLDVQGDTLIASINGNACLSTSLPESLRPQPGWQPLLWLIFDFTRAVRSVAMVL